MVNKVKIQCPDCLKEMWAWELSIFSNKYHSYCKFCKKNFWFSNKNHYLITIMNKLVKD